MKGSIEGRSVASDLRSMHSNNRPSQSRIFNERDELYALLQRDKELIDLVENAAGYFQIQLAYIKQMVLAKLHFIARSITRAPRKDGSYFDRIKKPSFHKRATQTLCFALSKVLQSTEMIVFLNVSSAGAIDEWNFQRGPHANDSYTRRLLGDKGRIVFRAIETVF